MRPIGSWRPTGRPALHRSISMDNSSGTGEKLAGPAKLGTWLDRAARPGLAEHDGKIELVLKDGDWGSLFIYPRIDEETVLDVALTVTKKNLLGRAASAVGFGEFSISKAQLNRHAKDLADQLFGGLSRISDAFIRHGKFPEEVLITDEGMIIRVE